MAMGQRRDRQRDLMVGWSDMSRELTDHARGLSDTGVTVTKEGDQ